MGTCLLYLALSKQGQAGALLVVTKLFLQPCWTPAGCETHPSMHTSLLNLI